MATAFRRKGSRVVAKLEPVEREIVVGLLEQTRQFLAPAASPQTGDEFEDLVATIGVAPPGVETGPRDPALDRLLPPGHRTDDAVAAEYRRLTEHGLRERKSATIDAAVDALRAIRGDRVSLDLDQGAALVVALTDVRLLLGERLGLRTDEDADDLAADLYAADLADRAGGGGPAGGSGAPGPSGPPGPSSASGAPGPSSPAPPDPRLHLAAYYDFLTWLQESLTHALSP